MRLFGETDGLLDRFDRAEWMTPPFDLSLLGTAITPSTSVRRAPTTVATPLRSAPTEAATFIRRAPTEVATVIRSA